MYSCEEVVATLAGYLDDQVAADIRTALEAHLAVCRACRVIYDSTRKTLRILTESRSFDLPEEISTRVMRNLRARIRSDR